MRKLALALALILSLPAWGTLSDRAAARGEAASAAPGPLLTVTGSAGAILSPPSPSAAPPSGANPLNANWNAGNFLIQSRNAVAVFNVRAYGAVGNNVSDDTAAFAAAIAAAVAAGGGTVYVPAGYTYKLTSQINIINNYISIEGDIGGSRIDFAPAVGGQAAFNFDNSRGFSVYCAVRNILFLSANTTLKKTAVRFAGMYNVEVTNVRVNDPWTGDGSVGVEIAGCAFVRIYNTSLYSDVPVDMPIRSGKPFAGADLMTIEGCQLRAKTDDTLPNIRVADPAVLTNFRVIDTDFAHGSYGLYCNSTDASARVSYYDDTITFDNCRWEQSTNATGYMIYLASPVGSNLRQNLNVRNCMTSPGANGIFASRVHTSIVDGYVYHGKGTALNISGTGTRLVTRACVLDSPSGATVTVGPEVARLSEHDIATGQLLNLFSTAPSFQMTDTTAGAKALRVLTHANVTSFYEAGGTAGDILSLDLANKRVGIGTAAPGVVCDINGGIATRSGTVALANGLASNIATPAFTYVRLTGPTGVFSIGGFAKPSDGRHLIVYNTVAHAMTIVNEDVRSTAANRIKTLTGGDVTLRSGTSAASFVYDGVDSRWILVSTN